MSVISRRTLLATSAVSLASLHLPGLGLMGASAGNSATRLRATTRTIDVNGRAATVYGLLSERGGPGLVLEPGQRMRVDLTNELDEETIVHWHGQIPPNAQDGARNTNPMIEPGASRSYDFESRPGTYWMHAHVPPQEIDMLAAPLIVRSADDLKADRQEVVMMLHDFSFTSGEEILAELAKGMAHHAMHHATGEMAHSDQNDMAMDHANHMNHGDAAMAGMGHKGMAMDLNDFNFDAYLANDRTLNDPEIVPVEKGGRVHLRVINGASMTAFWIDLGGVTGRLIAVDGDPVTPVAGTRFGIAMAQRLDIEIEMPSDGAALPIMALREGERERTGLILSPPGAEIAKISDMSDLPHPPVSGDMRMELALRARESLPERPVDRRYLVMLDGGMSPYSWSLNDKAWGEHVPIRTVSGERVELTFHNVSPMAHPMHLHGHVFQVVEVDGKRFPGALRDTVHVPSLGTVTVAFDAGEPAPWMLHCHHIAHMASGMMTEVDVRPA